MKDNGYHTEVKETLLQRNRERRYEGMRAVAESEGERVPVNGIDACRVAWEILDNMEE